MKKIATLWACIVVLVGVVALYYETKDYFQASRLQKVEAQTDSFKKATLLANRKLLVMKEEELRFKNYIASMQPEIIKNYKGLDEELYVSRSLASAYGDQKMLSISVGVEDRALENAKNLFRDKKYLEAIEKFKAFEDRYSQHPKIAEVMFLKAESYFLVKDYENALSSSLSLLEVFPENDLTGFILLRVAETYEGRQENLKAREVYDSISSGFENKTLKMLASQRRNQLDRN